MIRALLEGRKTQTRRIIKPRPWNADGDTVDISIAKSAAYVQGADAQWYYSFEHPLGGPLTAYVSTFNKGDLLYVRESHYVWSSGNKDRSDLCINYRATEPDAPCTWTPSIHMPRWASRLTLAVTDVRVQRLQEISEKDAEAEGVFRHVAEHSLDKTFRDERGSTALQYFRDLWKSIHGPRSWDHNPWVVAVTFDIHKVNVEHLVDANKKEEAL